MRSRWRPAWRCSRMPQPWRWRLGPMVACASQMPLNVPTVRDQRELVKRRVEWFCVDGERAHSKGDWSGQYIPLVYTTCEQMKIGQVVHQGHDVRRPGPDQGEQLPALGADREHRAHPETPSSGRRAPSTATSRSGTRSTRKPTPTSSMTSWTRPAIRSRGAAAPRGREGQPRDLQRPHGRHRRAALGGGPDGRLPWRPRPGAVLRRDPGAPEPRRYRDLPRHGQPGPCRPLLRDGDRGPDPQGVRLRARGSHHPARRHAANDGHQQDVRRRKGRSANHQLRLREIRRHGLRRPCLRDAAPSR
jgi:hypothetical protein